MSKSSRKTYKQTHSRRRPKPSIKAPTRLTDLQATQIARDIYTTLPLPSDAWSVSMMRSALKARYREFWEWQARPMRQVSREILRRVKEIEMDEEDKEEDDDDDEDGEYGGEIDGSEEGVEEDGDVDMDVSVDEAQDGTNNDKTSTNTAEKDKISQDENIQRDVWADLNSDEDLCEANEKILASMSEEWNGLQGHGKQKVGRLGSWAFWCFE